MSKDKRLLKEEDIIETQKKYAEHLSARTGESQEDIEKGREAFLRHSAEGLPEQYKPPYGAVSWYERFLEIAQSQKLEVVDVEFISTNIIDSHYASQILRGIKFLGLVDEKNKATNKLSSLRVIGDEFNDVLKDIVKNAYRDVFSTVVLSKASFNSLVNFFTQKYNFGISVAKQATQIFIMLCKKAEIELSFISKTEKTTKNARSEVPRKIPKQPLIVSTGQIDTSHVGMHEIKYGKIQILLPENDMEAATEAIELINLYIRRIEKAKKAASQVSDFFNSSNFFNTTTKKDNVLKP